MSEPGQGGDAQSGLGQTSAVIHVPSSGRAGDNGSRKCHGTWITGVCLVLGQCGLVGAGEQESWRPAKSLGSAGSMQAAGSDTNLWRRSPGCVQGKLLAGDTGRKKRYRESKKGRGCLGLAQAEEEAEDWPWPSCGQEKTETATFPAAKKELQSVSDNIHSLSYQDKHQTPVCPAHRGWGLGEQPQESCYI